MTLNWSFHRMKINSVAAITALMTLTFRPAFALNFTDAAENLLLFEYASQSADYCEQRGYPIRSIFLAWQPKYVHLQGESAKRILLFGLAFLVFAPVLVLWLRTAI